VAQIDFDQDLAERMEVIYRTRDIVRRRELVREALGAAPGERVLDVGCGPGFYVAELLEQVGPEGSVVGVDASEPMLAVAAKRCEGRDNVSFHLADATALPVDDGAFDAALSVQVFEYIADVGAALGELHRALRPGGRVLVWDVDWATVSLQSADPALTERALRAWDEHLTHPSLPRTLTGELRVAGFEDVRMEGHAFTANEYTPESYGGSLVPLIAEFVAGREGITEDQARGWAEELREGDDFYFACIQACFTATRRG
jgi:arsenite methyltransferase